MANYNGGPGRDIFIGDAEDDNVNAGEGDSVIDAGGGDNTVNTGSGNDTITAGKGNDVIIYSGGHDVITDLHNMGGEGVIFGNLGGQAVITESQWNNFLAANNATVDGNDVVISFDSDDSLTLHDFADNVAFL